MKDDALEALRRRSEEWATSWLIPYAAAWEKERAGFEALMPHVDTIKELAALRVEVQAVEEEIRETPQVDAGPRSMWLTWAERLRKARTGE